MQPRQQIGFFGVLVLVALRMATGWHFFDQGVDKFDPNFSSEGFLRSAKGPLAEHFQKLAHGVHDVDTLLLVPRAFDDPAQDGKPYAAWQEQITADWKTTSDAAAALAGDAAEPCKAINESYVAQLDSYLASQTDAMVEHQNELYRLKQLEADAPAGTLPYNDDRAAKKYGETFSNSRKWIASVRSLEAMYRDELIAAVEAAGGSRAAATKAVTPWTQLNTVNTIVKWAVVSIGACLILGLFTRLAAIGGAAFLTSVIATQPPWVHGAYTEYFWYQLVEVFALLAIAVFGAGKWIGLDSLWKHLWRRSE